MKAFCSALAARSNSVSETSTERISSSPSARSIILRSFMAPRPCDASPNFALKCLHKSNGATVSSRLPDVLRRESNHDGGKDDQRCYLYPEGNDCLGDLNIHCWHLRSVTACDPRGDANPFLARRRSLGSSASVTVTLLHCCCRCVV